MVNTVGATPVRTVIKEKRPKTVIFYARCADCDENGRAVALHVLGQFGLSTAKLDRAAVSKDIERSQAITWIQKFKTFRLRRGLNG